MGATSLIRPKLLRILLRPVNDPLIAFMDCPALSCRQLRPERAPHLGCRRPRVKGDGAGIVVIPTRHRIQPVRRPPSAPGLVCQGSRYLTSTVAPASSSIFLI